MIRFRQGETTYNVPSLVQGTHVGLGDATDPSVGSRSILERVTANGTLALHQASSTELQRSVNVLRARGLQQGAASFDQLLKVSRSIERNTDGRLRPPPMGQVAQAWLRASIWEDSFRRHIAINGWQRVSG